MKLMRGAVAIGIARKIYTEARKPENQRRIKQAADALRQRQAARGQGARGQSPRGQSTRSHRAR